MSRFFSPLLACLRLDKSVNDADDEVDACEFVRCFDLEERREEEDDVGITLCVYMYVSKMDTYHQLIFYLIS